MLSSALACLLVNPSGDRFIAVRHNTSLHASIYVASAPLKDFFAGAIVKDKKWENLPGKYNFLNPQIKGGIFLHEIGLNLLSAHKDEI